MGRAGLLVDAEGLGLVQGLNVHADAHGREGGLDLAAHRDGRVDDLADRRQGCLDAAHGGARGLVADHEAVGPGFVV